MIKKIYVVGFCVKWSRKRGRAYTLVAYTCDWPMTELHGVGKSADILSVWGDKDYSALVGKYAEAIYNQGSNNCTYAVDVRPI